MIKVLHILTDTNIGGAGTLLVNYLKNFDREKFLIKVILPMESLMKPRVEALGYEVIETKNLADKSMDVKGIFELMKIFKAEKPDIVHTHSSMSGKIAAYLTGVKSRIYTRHCAYDPPGYLTAFPGKQLNGFVNNTLSTHIVAVAEAAKENLTDTGVDERKITVIINGVEPLKTATEAEKTETRRKYGISDDDIVFGIVARLEAVKGHKYYVEAAAEIVKENPKAKFLIIGTGTEEENLRKQVKELNIEDNVIFTGFITDVASVINIMDINVNCSYGTETSSLALSEGMSLKKPAIASIYGGNPYMITHGENGLLCEKQNSKALYETMKILMNDEEMRAQMSETAYEHYKNKFTAEKMTKQLEAIYEAETLKRKGK